MSNNNNNNKNRKQKKGNAAAQMKKALKAEILNEIRSAAGQPAKGKGRGARNRRSKKEMNNSASAASVPFGQTGNVGRRREPQQESGDEYIADVTSSVAYAVTQYGINPGLASTFPWLSKKAVLYEKYRFRKLRFYYKPEVTEFTANGVGKVILSADFDASDSAPTSKQQQEDALPHADHLPCKVISMPVDPRDMNDTLDWHYVRFGGVPSGSDIKTFDAGVLNVGTIGQATAAFVGELHVEYEVEFKNRVLEANLPNGAGTLVGAGGSFAALTPFGAAPVATGLIVAAAAATNIVTLSGLTPGTELSVKCLINGTTVSAASFGSLTGMAQKSALTAFANAGGTSFINWTTFTVTAQVATAVLSVTAAAVASSYLEVAILSPAPSF